MAIAEQTAPMGHNNPPDPIEVLRAELAANEDSRKLIARRDELLAAVKRMPDAIGSEEAAGQFADMGRLLGTCATAAQDAKAVHKRPLLDQCAAIESFFRAISDPLAEAKRGIQAKLTTHLVAKRKKEQAAAAPKPQARGDMGAVATLRTEWTFEIEKLESIPLAKLRPYLDRTAIEKAIRAYVRAGGRQLKGVRIHEAPKAVGR